MKLNKEIPIDWQAKKISEIGKVKGGKRLPKGYVLQSSANGYPYITVADMKNGGVNLNSIKYAPIEVVEKIKNYTISCKDIYITVVGSTLGSIGIIPEELDGALLTENADKITDLKVNQKYLLFVLDSPIFQNIISNERTVNAQPKLAINKINNFVIPVPPEIEQQKIAEILSTWDKTIDLKEKLIEEKKLQKKGIMKKLLTGEVRFPGFESEWNEVKLGDVIKEINIKTTENNQYPVLTSSRQGIFLQEEYFNKSVASSDNSGYKVIKKGQFTYRTMSDDGSFKFNQLTEHEVGVVSPAYVVFEAINIDPIYLKFLMDDYSFNEHIIKVTQGGTRLSLKYNSLSQFVLNIPAPHEQKAISEIFKTVDRGVHLLEFELKALKLQKKGLMQMLLTGIVRVSTIDN